MEASPNRGPKDSLEKASLNPGRQIVIVGGGIVGCSIAYYLTQHPQFDRERVHINVLEADEIAGAASGKAGGFVASWATPKCLAKLSFDLHEELATRYGGQDGWGYRKCSGWDMTWRKPDQAIPPGKDEGVAVRPPGVDWINPGAVESYTPLGTPEDSAQVIPFHLTDRLRMLAEEGGAVFSTRSKATRIIYSPDSKKVTAIEYQTGTQTRTLGVDDLIIAAGPWSPTLLPRLRMGYHRSHSIVHRTPSTLSPNILFPIYEQENSTADTGGVFPEIYPRPADTLSEFPTVYTCGPDDEEPLPETSGDVQVDMGAIGELQRAVRAVSDVVAALGEPMVKQACYKPQLRPHEEGEEVGPAVGPVRGVMGLWVATGHDEWGISNGPGTGLVMAEWLLEGKPKSLVGDGSVLDPMLWMV